MYIGLQGRNHWGGSGGPDPPNFCLDPSNILGNFFLGGVRVQYVSCIFHKFCNVIAIQ